MNNVIFDFLSSRPNDKNHGHILMVKGNEVVIADKKDVSRITRFKAKLGFGNAALHFIAEHVRKNNAQMEGGTQARFNRYLERYNEGRVFWKKAVIDMPVSLNKCTKYRAEALFIKVLNTYKTDHELDALINSIHELSEAISELDPEDKKMNKALFTDILEMKREMKQGKERETLKKELKQLHVSIRKKHFAKQLARMDEVLTQIENRFEQHKGSLQCQEFIREQLAEWRQALNQGKLISIPKWYHCTKTSTSVCTIATSKLKYMHKQAFPGAFVSNKPETGFGDFGIAMSSRIEKKGTKSGHKKFAKLPKASLHRGLIFCGEVNDDLYPGFRDKQKGTLFWLGFQKRSGIPLKREKLPKKQLAYDKDNTIAFIFYSNNRFLRENEPRGQVIDKLCDFGQKHKIKVVKAEEACALRDLINTTYPLGVDKEWKGKVKNFRGQVVI